MNDIRFYFQAFFHLLWEYWFVLQKHVESIFPHTPPSQWKNGGKGDIVIIPGFFETWITFQKIADFLNDHGYRVHVLPHMGRNFGSIDTMARIVQSYLQKNDLKDVVLLSHSKGGIIAKYLLVHDEEKRIKTSISISSPYGGACIGKIPILHLEELAHDSRQIRLLGAEIKINEKIINIYPVFDNVIAQKSLVLHGVKNIQLRVFGHTKILEEEAVWKTVLKHIEKNESRKNDIRSSVNSGKMRR